MNENMKTEQIIYKFRYFLADVCRKVQVKFFHYQIKLENKNYWNEYNPNFRK